MDAADRVRSIDKDDEAQLLATIDKWVDREVAPKVKEFDHADRWPADLVEQIVIQTLNLAGERA